MGCVCLPHQTGSSSRAGTGLNPMGPPQTLAPGHRGLLGKHLQINKLIVGLPCPLSPEGMFLVGSSRDRHSCFLILSHRTSLCLKSDPAISMSARRVRQAPAAGSISAEELISQAHSNTCARQTQLECSP